MRYVQFLSMTNAVSDEWHFASGHDKALCEVVEQHAFNSAHRKRTRPFPKNERRESKAGDQMARNSNGY